MSCLLKIKKETQFHLLGNEWLQEADDLCNPLLKAVETIVALLTVSAEAYPKSDINPQISIQSINYIFWKESYELRLYQAC